MEHFDTIIIGTGAGGGTIAHKLAASGRQILILERGGFLPREKQNWDPASVFVDGAYNCGEQWVDRKGNLFEPGTHYFVGGNTKVYGAALFRLRERDFEEIEHYGGISPAWPLKYKDFQPYYLAAEKLYQVHGARGQDPTEPLESNPYFHPPVSHEPFIQKIFDRIQAKGWKPFHLPLGVRLNEKHPENSLCIRCDTCDGYPCLADAKSDAHHLCIQPILGQKNVKLLLHAKATRLIHDPAGKKISAVEVELNGKQVQFSAREFIVSCGAINSSALLLRSKSSRYPDGLANSSGLVGKNYMCHINSAVIALSKEKNRVRFQKTIGLNDYYSGAEDSKLPLGHIQLLGKVKGPMLQGDAPFFTPRSLLRAIADHGVGWWITSEDLPSPKNQVKVDESGKIHLHQFPTNEEAHRRLLKKLKEVARAGNETPTVFLTKRIPIGGVAHQVGTLRFGNDPKTSVLDLNCRTHDIENLYVVDGSFFPSSGAVNPGLTIIANALRVGDFLTANR